MPDIFVPTSFVLTSLVVGVAASVIHNRQTKNTHLHQHNNTDDNNNDEEERFSSSAEQPPEEDDHLER